MEENKNLAIGQVAENVAQTTEETAQPKMFTQEEMNQAVSKGKARERAKIRKEYERKYGDLENVLRAGTGKESVEEMTDTFLKFYESKGITLPQKPVYSDGDLEILAKAEAADVIGAGYDDVVEEVDRLSELGVENMTAREKAYFKVLAEHRQKTERQNELTRIGVTEDVYSSKDFQDFASMFSATTPIEKIYSTYMKTQPKKPIKPMGSMKNSTSEDGTVKDFYTRDEALQFTKADFDKDPALFKAVQASMLKW